MQFVCPGPVQSEMLRRIGIDDRRQGKEFGKAAALNMVVTKSITQDVGTDRLAAVILYLGVLLERFLRSQKVGAGAELIGAAGQAVRVLANAHADAGQRIEHALRAVSNSVAELGIAESQGVRVNVPVVKSTPSACTGVLFTLVKG